jgi:hypothetical protein
MKPLSLHLFAAAAVACLVSSIAQAGTTSTVVSFQDSVFANVGASTVSDARSHIAPPPTSSTVHNYQAYNTNEEVRMYAAASTSPGTQLSFAFGQDGYASYTLFSSNNKAGAVMKVGESFHIKIDLTNTEATWQDLTLQARHGLRYGIYANDQRSRTGSLQGSEYLHALADFSLRIDGAEVWESIFDRRMDTSGANPYAYLRNDGGNEPFIDIALGTWAPLETRVLEFSFNGSVETNANDAANLMMSMAPIFNAGSITAALGQPRDPFGGGANPVTPVPEPSTYALMLAGLAVTGWVARRRRRA